MNTKGMPLRCLPVLPRGADRMTPRIGIPNEGRLRRDVLDLLSSQGIHIDAGNRNLVGHSADLDVLQARSADIPALLELNVIDMGITGLDYAVEATAEVTPLVNLRLQEAVVGVLTRPESPPITTVVSQYPALAARHFSADHDVQVFAITGAAELYVSLGIADAAVDVWMTGETARSNGLILTDIVMATSAHLFARDSWPRESARIQESVEFWCELFAQRFEAASPVDRPGGL